MSHQPVKVYEISYQEYGSFGGIKFVQLTATSKEAALKAFNKIIRKRTFRMIRIKEVS